MARPRLVADDDDLHGVPKIARLHTGVSEDPRAWRSTPAEESMTSCAEAMETEVSEVAATMDTPS